jgi:hypothetical protein
MVRDLVGSASGPSDLASNKKRLRGCGQVRRPVPPHGDPSRGEHGRPRSLHRDRMTVPGIRCRSGLLRLARARGRYQEGLTDFALFRDFGGDDRFKNRTFLVLFGVQFGG